MKAGSREFRDHASTYLRRAQRGEETLILHRGKPIAKLVPIVPMKASLQADLGELLDRLDEVDALDSRPIRSEGTKGWLLGLERIGTRLPEGAAQALLDLDRDER